MEMEQGNYPKIRADGWNHKAQAGVCLVTTAVIKG